MTRRIGLVFISLVLLTAGTARAQEASGEPTRVSSFVADFAKDVALDPTTYTPAAILYQSMRLDWKSSQPFFRQGYVEANERYTVTGLAHDVPVSYEVGNRRILSDALATLPMSFANNASSRLFETMLVRRFPNHPKLIRALGWIERASFASYMSYRLSSKHFAQWQTNEALARQLGFK